MGQSVVNNGPYEFHIQIEPVLFQSDRLNQIDLVVLSCTHCALRLKKREQLFRVFRIGARRMNSARDVFLGL